MSEYKPGTNFLIEALSASTRAMFGDELQACQIDFGTQLYSPGKSIESVYFPITSVISLLTVVDNQSVEVATIGSEGMSGVPVLLGVDVVPGLAIVQIAGWSWRISAPSFRQLIRTQKEFASLLQKYSQTVFNQMAQTAACNRAHTIIQRCARWLLIMDDRVQSHEYPLTQDFLSRMLGVRRAGINEVAQTMQDKGCIKYGRGIVQITDRPRLESMACECYAILRKDFANILAGQISDQSH